MPHPVIRGAKACSGLWWRRASGSGWPSWMRSRVSPFRTFACLAASCRSPCSLRALLAYGLAAVAVVHGAAREPSLLLGASFFFFILESDS